MSIISGPSSNNSKPEKDQPGSGQDKDEVRTPSARRNRRGATSGAEGETEQRKSGSVDMPSEQPDAKPGQEKSAEIPDADSADQSAGQDEKSAAATTTVEAKKTPTDKPGQKPTAESSPSAPAVPAAPDLPQVINTTPAPQSGGASALFGPSVGGDTSGFSGLQRQAGSGIPLDSSPRPYGSYFDDVANSIAAGYPNWSNAHIATLVDRGEVTFYVKKQHIAKVMQVLRDDPALRFELLSSVSGVDYLRSDAAGSSSSDPRAEQYAAERLHVVYHLLSLTYRRRIRVEIATTVEDPHVPSVCKIYPTADWQEREAYDMFGVIFDGHQALTRILMPDDWDGFPQRKDYPLGGIDVEYKGASIPPPDERRSYR